MLSRPPSSVPECSLNDPRAKKSLIDRLFTDDIHGLIRTPTLLTLIVDPFVFHPEQFQEAVNISVHASMKV